MHDQEQPIATQTRSDAASAGLSAGSGRRNESASLHRRVTRLKPALWFLLALAGLYGLAVWSVIGQSTENALVAGQTGRASILHWSLAAGLPPLKRGSAALAAGVVLIAAVALLRRRWREGVAGIGIAVATVATTMTLHAVLPRPGLVSASQGLTGASFPSGTTAITAGLALGAAVVVSPSARPYVAALGALWLAGTAGAVQALSWHRPSDVLGATLLACVCHATATALLPRGEQGERGERGERGGTRRSRALPPLALAAAAALPASGREDSIARPLVFAGVAFTCAALVWITATGHSFRPGRRTESMKPDTAAGSSL
ncbi:membrane-associated phospholipid phosphatase [Kitasatospora sp. MAA4]|uniref:prepilin peptidase n=1 Tax=Kitasatospora sp. MAA4 TaxID=3035093 RepID=UPI002474E81B|nr:prepilin peptidase [Kitasatospora sp. MAA4]MDH6133748.1 membrane-associated phospholipid phosphatase [Kitasatospora sp. MAA4]